MQIFAIGRRIVALGATAAIFAACSSGARTNGSTALLPNVPAQKSGFKSFMLPQARDAKYLLYVSSFYYGIVHVFDFRKRTVVGLIAGLNQPTGQCVDPNGNIWISQADAHEVVEYLRASLKQIRTVQVYRRPFGCSVAPNGDLAVADYDAARGSGPGDVEVFKKASGTPNVYTCNGFANYPFSPGYDAQGNLFVEAMVSYQTGGVGLCVLLAGGTSLNPVNADITFHQGGGAMWDGQYMTLADVYHDQSFRDSTLIYRVNLSPSGGVATVGKTGILHSNISQPFILGSRNTPVNQQQGTVVVGPDQYHVTRWKYPSGVKNSVPYVMVPNEVPFGESITIRP